MIKHIAPLLANMTITLVIQEGSVERPVRVVLVPKRRRKTGDEEMDKPLPPIILSGTPEKLDNELNSQRIQSALSDFNQFIADTAQFETAMKRKKEAAEKKAAKTPSTTPAKTAAAPKKEKLPDGAKWITDNMDKLQGLIDDANKVKAEEMMDKMRVMAKKLGKEKLESLGLMSKLKEVSSKVKAMPEQTNLEFDV